MVWILGIGFFLALLFAFPKQLGGLLLIIIAIGIAAWAYTDQKEKAAAREKAKILMSAKTDTGCANPAYPIGISISNGTSKQINSISFDLRAVRPGFSSNVYSDYLTSDRILKPGDVYFSCWALEPYELRTGKIAGIDPKSLSWSTSVSSVVYAE